MRVAELADLTGTTVRTIRYYHRVGLLPIPATAGGRRDYDLSHVARVSRIRWLAAAGLSLTTIAELLPEPVEPPQVDLAAALSALDDRITELRAQRERLAALIDTVSEDGGTQLSPMPARVSAFYAAMEARAPDERTARAIRRERDFNELAYYRGEMPAEAELLYEAPTERDVLASLSGFGQDPASLSDNEIAAVADAVVARMEARIGAGAAGTAKSVDIAMVNRVYDLYMATATPGERRVGAAVQQRLVAAIERWRGQ